MLICVTVLILNHDLFSYFHIGNVNTQTTVDEPGPQLVVEHPPQGLFPLSFYIHHRVSSPSVFTSTTGSLPPQCLCSDKYLPICRHTKKYIKNCNNLDTYIDLHVYIFYVACPKVHPRDCCWFVFGTQVSHCIGVMFECVQVKTDLIIQVSNIIRVRYVLFCKNAGHAVSETNSLCHDQDSNLGCLGHNEKY